MPDITHVVYVDPEGYAQLQDRADLLAVGEAVGKLNKLLPKRQFILIGPGRWGSRGDIKLGVSVTYSDINNTAMLIEIARKTGDYLPDLSFGTHFFQDLVEVGDPLPSALSRRRRLSQHAPAPRFAQPPDGHAPGVRTPRQAIRVIDVPSASGGRVLRVLMNSELDEAIAVLAEAGRTRRRRPAGRRDRPAPASIRELLAVADADGGEDRLRDRPRTVRRRRPCTSSAAPRTPAPGPSSDIDLLIHFRGDDEQRHDLEIWLEGWSLCLGEINYLRTGYVNPDLLDVHIITDEDIERQTSFAAKIGAVTDAALELPLGKPSE